MQVAVVQGRKPVDILDNEIGDVKARVNEERITQDDFAGTGGAVDSGSLVHGTMWALMMRSVWVRQGVELRTDLDLPKRLDRVAVDSLELRPLVGSRVGRK